MVGMKSDTIGKLITPIMSCITVRHRNLVRRLYRDMRSIYARELARHVTMDALLITLIEQPSA